MKNISGNILIVDDLLENLQVLNKMLKNEGYKVRKAINGKTALIACQSSLPDLILLDIKMPEMDGFEVCQKLKSNETTKDIPVIFISALDEIFNKVKAFEIGGIDYITKPFQEEEVIARIKNQLTIQNQRKLLQEEIKQRKKIELELKQVNQDLEAFNYSMAHDLRNPINNIKLLAEVIKLESDKLDEQCQQYLDLIDQSAQRMTQIIKSLLMLFSLKKQKIIIESINLSDIVIEIITNLNLNQPERKVEIIIEPEIIVNGDQHLLKIALENLVNNAWKYSSKQEISRLEFGLLSLDKEEDQTKLIASDAPFCSEEKRLCQNNFQFVYFIKDNGVGFDIKKAQGLFTSFKRFHTDNDFEGTGIGLSIVERIIHYHHGLIWCNSQVNQGATFYFTLGTK